MSAATVLTPTVQAAIVAELEKGNYRAVAAASAGISERTFRYWFEWGKEGREPYRAFLEAVEQAESKIESQLLSEIRNAQPAVTGVQGGDVWQARAWVLERRWPKRWSGRVRLAITEEVGALEEKLRRNPELAQRVADALSQEAVGDDGKPAAH